MPRGSSAIDDARLQRRLWTLDLLRPALWLDWADVSTISLATGISEVRDKSVLRRYRQGAATRTRGVGVPVPHYFVYRIQGGGIRKCL